MATVTDADLALLRVAAEHADMVALSFLHHERDVDTLRDYLDRVGAKNCGLVLKIETREAFVRLPEILLHAMQSPRVGVMIARVTSLSRWDMSDLSNSKRRSCGCAKRLISQ